MKTPVYNNGSSKTYDCHIYLHNEHACFPNFVCPFWRCAYYTLEFTGTYKNKIGQSCARLKPKYHCSRSRSLACHAHFHYDACSTVAGSHQLQHSTSWGGSEGEIGGNSKMCLHGLDFAARARSAWLFTKSTHTPGTSRQTVEMFQIFLLK